MPTRAVDEPLRRSVSYIKLLPTLAMIDDAVLEEMASRARLAHFGRGESAIYQNQPDVKLHFVLAGSAIATP
ncbi:MAG: hypothetical protein WA984_06785 [Phormidesmis sp.]